MLHKISYRQFTTLYKTHIKRDFALPERRPLTTIKKLYKQERYTCITMNGQNEMLAYACFVHSTEVNAVLLDYFAVIPEQRGKGAGSIFLKQLQKAWETGGIIIESDMQSKAPTVEENITRGRRISFYETNGAQKSHLGWKAFGVNYSLLWLPVNEPLNEEKLAAYIQGLYAFTLPRFIQKTQTKLYPLHNME